MKSRTLRRFAIFVGVLALLRGTTAYMDVDIRHLDREEKPREGKSASTAPIPKECADGASANTGQPVMLERTRIQTLTWGVSTKPARYGQTLPIVIWIDNPTDESQFVATCGLITGFSELTELFDSSGRRMFRYEERRPRNPGFGVCTSSFSIKITPHTCLHGTFSDLYGGGAESFLQYDLTENYNLLPGKYIITARLPNQATIDAGLQTPTAIDQNAGLIITVEDWGFLDRLFHLSTLVNYGKVHLEAMHKSTQIE